MSFEANRSVGARSSNCRIADVGSRMHAASFTTNKLPMILRPGVVGRKLRRSAVYCRVCSVKVSRLIVLLRPRFSVRDPLSFSLCASILYSEREFLFLDRLSV